MNYIILVIYSALCFGFISKKYKATFLLCITFGLVFFSGFRFESAIDYFSYLSLYNASYMASTEYLYWSLSIMHHYVFNSFPLFVLMVSAITIPVKIYVLNRLSANIFVSIFIFFCLSYIYVDMGFIRNSISLAFFMLSLLFYMKNKKFLSIFLFSTAFFFHHSVLFLAYMFFLNPRSNVVISKKYLLLLIVCFFLSYFEIAKLYLIALVDQLSFLGYLHWKLVHYLESEAFQNTSINIYNLRYLFVSLVFYYFRNRIQNQFLIKIYLLGTSLLLLVGFNIQLYGRVGLYLSIFEMLLVSCFISSYRGKYRFLLISSISVFYGIIFFRITYIMDIHLVKFL